MTVAEGFAQRDADVVLRNGSTAHIRPLHRDDLSRVRAFLGGLSLQSRAFRFFSAGADLDRAAEQAVRSEPPNGYSLIATSGHDGRVVGHAIYVRIDHENAESAFAVADEFQGLGLGTILLAHLAEAAAEAGILAFVNDVLPENHRMVDVFRESGFPVVTRSTPGLLQITVPTSLTPEGLERFWDRERTSAEAALAGFLRPTAVAVIGPSSRRGTVGGEVFHNLEAAGFAGALYRVDADANSVQPGAPMYLSIVDVPASVDLAVIVVPAVEVLPVARACGEKGVRSLIVVSAGFAETGSEGGARQRELLATSRQYGMRVIGPNCIGVMNTDPAVSLNATFASTFPQRGRVGFLSQSGALGLAVIDHATELGLGISSFVSVGNKVDISGNDVLQYWEQDDDTDVVLLYLESFGNPRNFGRIARRVGRRKPIVAVKSGRTAAGARATSSHTGALIAGSDVTVDALFKQSGVVRTDTLAELFDVASILANQPIPSGDRVAIVTNAGGPGILCADACEALGLTVPSFDGVTRMELYGSLPAEASANNPVDLTVSADAGMYRRTIDAIVMADLADAIIAIFVPPFATAVEDVASALRAGADDVQDRVTLVTVLMSSSGASGALGKDRPGPPNFRFPEDAARAVAHAARYGRWRRRPPGETPSFEGIDADRAAAIIAEALRRGETWLTPDEVEGVLSCYGLPIVPSRLVKSGRAAGVAAVELGGRVALKGIAKGLVHKSEVRAVRLGLAGRSQVERAAREIRRAFAETGRQADGFVVQPMVEGGVEMVVGMVHDPTFGPVVVVGAGGVAAELTSDVAVRLTPLTDLDASEMIRSLATFPLLDGHRGSTRLDVAALEDVVLRVGAMVEAHGEIAEVDLDPVKVLPDSAVIVDSRVRVERAPARRPLLARAAV